MKTSKKKLEEINEVFYNHNFHQGRMISYSKSSYCKRNPNNLVIFNANIVTDPEGKVWHGDLDVTVDQLELEKIAKELKKDLYILYEMDCRFDTEKDKLKDLKKRAKTIIKFEDEGK
jgi:hypothetical protein